MNSIIFVNYLFFLLIALLTKLGVFCHIKGDVNRQRLDAEISLPAQIRLRIRILP
jgi:hypothetical protein